MNYYIKHAAFAATGNYICLPHLSCDKAPSIQLSPHRDLFPVAVILAVTHVCVSNRSGEVLQEHRGHDRLQAVRLVEALLDVLHAAHLPGRQSCANTHISKLIYRQ